MALPAEIQTKRLKLRPVAPEDAGAVVAALNDLAVTGWWSVVPYPYAAADFHHFRAEIAKPGDYVVCLGAGSITNWANALPGQLAALRDVAR